MKLTVAVLAFVMSGATVGIAEPRVPAGTDPGGLPVALIGPGIDYTQPEIAQRLARDGEGEIVGFDVADDDHRPFAKEGSTSTAKLILGEAGAAVLVPLKADVGDAMSVAKAIAYAARGPSRVIALDLGEAHGPASAALGEAARHFPDRLFLIAAGDDAADLDAIASAQTGAKAGNVIVATAAGADGVPDQQANWGATSVDIAVDIASDASAPTLPANTKPSSRALGRLAALAARLGAIVPDLDGASLKSRILELAQPLPVSALRRVTTGVLIAPWRPFRPE